VGGYSLLRLVEWTLPVLSPSFYLSAFWSFRSVYLKEGRGPGPLQWQFEVRYEFVVFAQPPQPCFQGCFILCCHTFNLVGVEAGSIDRGVDSWYTVKRCEVVLHQYLSYFQEDLCLLKLEELQLLRLRPCRDGRAVQGGFRSFNGPAPVFSP